MMEKTNCSIDNPEELQKIELTRPMNNVDSFGGVPINPVPEDFREAKKLVSSEEDTMTVENMSTAIFLHQTEQRQESAEQTRRSYPRRNSAIASMLMEKQSSQESANKDPPEPRHRYQRRNSAVASMLFPSMIVRSLHDSQPLEPTEALNRAQHLVRAGPSDSLRLIVGPSSDTKRRRSSVPWSQVYETSRSTTPVSSPAPKKCKRAENDQSEP